MGVAKNISRALAVVYDIKIIINAFIINVHIIMTMILAVINFNKNRHFHGADDRVRQRYREPASVFGSATTRSSWVTEICTRSNLQVTIHVRLFICEIKIHIYACSNDFVSSFVCFAQGERILKNIQNK